MTDQQLEAAALKLCELRGWNAESQENINAAKRDVVDFYHVAKAIDFAFTGEAFP
jgi:hypothetical protein